MVYHLKCCMSWILKIQTGQFYEMMPRGFRKRLVLWFRSKLSGSVQPQQKKKKKKKKNNRKVVDTGLRTRVRRAQCKVERTGFACLVPGLHSVEL